MVKEAAKKKSMKGNKDAAGSGGPLKIMIPAVVVVLVAAAAVFGVRHFMPHDGKADTVQFQKGMGYVTWSQEAYLSPESDTSMAAAKDIGSQYISILVTWYQSACWSSDIHRTGSTPSDKSIRHAIQKAHELGMKVMLKPHLDILDTSDGSWRGEIGCRREADWEKWFQNYTDYIMHYVKIAEEEGVEIFCIGTELSTTATTKGYMWSDIIKTIRANYSGQLTYAAHWDRYMDIRFWNQLDYVGINAYFPLTEKLVPTYDEMMESWKKWVAEIEAFQSEVQKPIIFPEAGCNSAEGAAIRPWEHIPRSEVDVKLQENYYKALLDTFWDKEWFYGLYWWYWGTNVNMGGIYNRGFTPQRKPAEELVKEFYAKQVHR